MPSKANWRGEVGSALGTSNVYDLDNVYLSDRGWVYRHYKNVAKTEFWDEILVAGGVPDTDTPDAFGADGTPPANPTFLPQMNLEGMVSDGFQAPLNRAGVVAYLGALSIAGDATAYVGETKDYTVSFSGTAADATYQWADVADVTETNDTTATVTAAFTAAGTKELEVVVTSATPDISPLTDSISVVVSTPTLTGVAAASGADLTPLADGATTHTYTAEATADTSDLVYSWAVINQSGGTAPTLTGENTATVTATFPADTASETMDLVCTVSSALADAAAGTSQNQVLTLALAPVA